jgi:4-hydroxy-4-methyl-2-oxoglutarate aldolase
VDHLKRTFMLQDSEKLTATLAELREFDTALIANTIGYIDPTPAHEYYLGGSIGCLTPALGPTVGVAVTCELESSTPNVKPDWDLYWEQLDEMSKMRAPLVWVVKTTGSRPDHECVLGDGMAKMLHAAGCIGVVTDGGARDLHAFPSIPFAAYGRGKTIHHCAIRVGAINQPVELGGVTIHPGDFIHANAEGVIRIPPGCLYELPEKAVKMRAFEQDAHRHLRRTDLSAAEKRQLVQRLIIKHGFAPAEKVETGEPSNVQV